MINCIWDVIRDLRVALWDGATEEMLGGLPGPRWSVVAVGPTEQWSAKGLAIHIPIPIYAGRARVCEATLEMMPNGMHVKSITTSVEGETEVVTHRTDPDALIAFCLAKRKSVEA